MSLIIWEGIYESFDQVPEQGSGHQGDEWLTKSIARAKDELAKAKKPGSISLIPAYDRSLLPFLAALVAPDKTAAGRPLTIVDFGGGLGAAYIPCRAALPQEIRLDFQIIEVSQMVRAGRELFTDDEELTFQTELPELAGRADIVHLGSALHYVQDWRAKLAELVAYEPEYLLFTDLVAGDNKTYVTAQKYYDSLIPVWMVNINEILDHLAGLGWQLLFKAVFQATIRGEAVAELPMDNFPPDHRLGNGCHLLLSRPSPLFRSDK